jgi:uncharacterized repeat protein (TIGR03803 family)
MNKPFRLLIVTLFLSAFALGQAQEKVLYTFTGSPDGAAPKGKLIADKAGNLYGTTFWGGINTPATLCSYVGMGCGAVFELSPNSDGSYSETILHDFCSSYSGARCLDGAFPVAGLLSDAAGNLYGTTSGGGGTPCQCGIAFEMSPPTSQGGQWGFTTLYAFCASYPSCPDGDTPMSTLVSDANGDLYGTTWIGGANKEGTVFELTPGSNGWTESVLYSFCAQANGIACADGAQPQSAVTFDKSGNLYGTTLYGGSTKYAGGGVVYELSPSANGWSEKILLALTSQGGARGGALKGAVNFDSAGNLYSTANSGGSSGNGVVFRLNANNYAEEHLSFNGTNGSAPTAGVLMAPGDKAIYGTTSVGGVNNLGEVYKIIGDKLSVVYNFVGPDGTDGAYPEGALIIDNGNLFGTTEQGGILGSECYDEGCGTVFEITK